MLKGSSRNKVADKESRELRDNLEWSLKEKFFETIVGNFGPVTTDLSVLFIGIILIILNQMSQVLMLSPIARVIKLFMRFRHLP